MQLGSRDGRIFGRSVSAIQFDDECDYKCSWTVLPFSTYVTESVAPLAVCPPPGLDFDFNYGMVEHTPPGSLFATGPSGSGAHDEDEDEDDAEVDEDKEEEEDDAEAVRRNV
ncbi:hypothetical protein V6N13_076577 [Hibiscus sabdariffa]